MPQNSRYQRRVFDTGNHSECAATSRAGLDVDGKDAPEALHPAHRGRRLIGIDAPGPPRHDAGAVFEVGCEYTRDGFAPLLLKLRVRRAVALACAVETSQVESRARHQCGESRHKI